MKKFFFLSFFIFITTFIFDNKSCISANGVGEYSQNYHLNSTSGFMNDIQSIFFDQTTKE